LIKAVIFDLDGVLINTEMFYLELLSKTFAHFGISLTPDQMEELPGAASDLFNKYIERNLASTSVPLDQFNAHMKYLLTVEPVPYRELMFEGVDRTIMYLSERHYRLAVASNSRASEIETALSALGLTQYFEFFFSSELFTHPKPSPEVYFGCIERLHLPPESIVVIEDSEYGIKAAKAANLTCIARREERFTFDQSAADYIVDQIPEIVPIIEQIP
jgi:HAD superfamily hydrolase (TIGR01509 family)